MNFLANMESFVALGNMRNFGRAAIALGITPSTLSRRLAGLERELGCVLVRRSTRSFALTESGQAFLESSKRLIEEALKTKEELGANFKKISGHLRVGAPADLATTILARLFGKYCRENPTVSMEMISTQNQPELNRGPFDVAFAVAHQTSLPDSMYSARLVGSFPRMMYASKAYLKRKGIPSTPQELRDHACIRFQDGSAEKYWELHCDRKRQTIAIDGACAFSSVLVAAQAAREHLGIAMLPQHLATHPFFGAGLIRVLADWQGAKANVFAITPDRRLPAKTEELIRVVKAEFTRRVAHTRIRGRLMLSERIDRALPLYSSKLIRSRSTTGGRFNTCV